MYTIAVHSYDTGYGTTMGMMRTILLHASRNHWLRERLPRFRFARSAVKRFMPGEDIDSALNAAKEFQPRKISVVLTYLGENVSEPNEAKSVASHYRDVLGKISGAALDCEISVKLTQLGHDISTDLSYENMKAIIRDAEASGNFVWIDMEDSSYVDSTLALYRRLRAEHKNVGVCVQSYLYRTSADIDSLIPLSPAIRLVKGAYNEPPDRAFPKKQAVDQNYMALAMKLLRAAKENGTRVGLATHDPKLVAQICIAAEKENISKNLFEFQMLYGIRRGALSDLVSHGYRGRVLISYGPAWYPWYMRRLAERPANVLFVLRNLVWS